MDCGSNLKGCEAVAASLLEVKLAQPLGQWFFGKVINFIGEILERHWQSNLEGRSLSCPEGVLRMAGSAPGRTDTASVSRSSIPLPWYTGSCISRNNRRGPNVFIGTRVLRWRPHGLAP